MRIINKINNSYNNIMNRIFDREFLPCCLMKLFTLTFFFMSIYLFFMSGRYFEFGYYGQFAWYIIGGLIAYNIYWLSLKQMCWSELRSKNIRYEECCIKRNKLVNAEELSDN